MVLARGCCLSICFTSIYSHHEYSSRGLLYQQIQSPRVLESRLAVLADIVTTSTRVEACCTSRYSHHEYSSTRGRVEACCTSRYSHHEYSRTSRGLLYQQIQSPRVLADESMLAVLADIVTTSTRGRVDACCTSRYSHHEYSRTSRGLLYQQIQSPRVLEYRRIGRGLLYQQIQSSRVLADGSRLAVLADIVTTSTRGRVEACCTSRYSHHEYSWTSRGLLYQQIQSPRVLVDESMLAVLADIVTTSTRGRVDACCTSRYSHHEYSRTSRGLLYQQIQSPRVLEYWRTGRGLLYQQIQSSRVLADGSRLAVLADIVTTSTRGRVEACCTSRYSHHEYSWTSRGLLYQQIQSPRVLEYWRTGRGLLYQQIQSSRVLADGSMLAVLADIVTTSTRGRVEACCTSRYSHHEYSSTGGQDEASRTSRYSHHEYSRTSRGLLYQQIQSPRVLADGSMLAVLADIVTTSTRGRVEACCTSRYSHHEYSRTSRGLLYQQIQSPRVLADESRLAVLADIVTTSTRGRVDACCTSRYSHHEYSRTSRGLLYQQIQSPRVLEYSRTCRGLLYQQIQSPRILEYSRTSRGLLYQQIQSPRVLADGSMLAVLADIVTTSTRGRVEACCTSRYSHHEYSLTGRGLLYQQIQSPRVLVDESRLAVLADIVTTSTRGRGEACCTSRYSHHEYSSTGGQVEACCTSRYSHHEYSQTGRCLLYQQIQSPRVLVDESRLAVLADIVTTSTRGRVEACCTSRYSHHEYSRTSRGLLYQQIQSPRVLADESRLAVLADIVTTSTRGRVEACCTSRYSHHEYSRTSRGLLYQQIQSPRVLADESRLAVLADIVTTSTRGRVDACCTSRYSHHEYSRTSRGLLYQQIQSPRVLEYSRTGRGLLYQQIQSSRVLADGSMLAVLADIVTTSTRGRVEACCTSRYSHHEYSWTSRGLLYQQIQSPRVLEYWRTGRGLLYQQIQSSRVLADGSMLAVLADIVTTSTRGRVEACCTSRYSHHEYSWTCRGLLYQQIQSPRVLADESRLAVLADIVTTSTRGRVEACCTSRYSHHEYSRTSRGLLYQQIQSPRVLADGSMLAVLADIVTTSTRGRVEACCTSRYSHHEYSRTSRGLLYQQIQSPRVLADESRLAVLADIVTTSTRGRVDACCTSRYSHHEYSRTSRGLLYQQIQSPRVLEYSRTCRGLLYQQIQSPRVLADESRLAVLADIVTTNTRVLADESRLAVLADIVTTSTRGRVDACCTSRYSHHEYSRTSRGLLYQQIQSPRVLEYWRTGRGLLYQQIQSSRVLADGSRLAVLADIVTTSTRGRVEACCTSRYSHHEYSWTSRGLLYQQIQSPRVLEYWRTGRGLLYQQIQSSRVLADGSMLAVLADIVTTSTRGRVEACCTSRYSHHEYSRTSRGFLYQQIQSPRVLADESRLAVLADIVTTSTRGRVDACCTSRYSHHEYSRTSRGLLYQQIQSPRILEYSRTSRGLLYQQIQSPRVLADESMLAVLADIVTTSTRGRVDACCTSRYSHHEYSRTSRGLLYQQIQSPRVLEYWRSGRGLLYQQIQSSRVLADGSMLAVLADIVTTSTRGRVEACCTSRYSHHEYSRTSRGLLYQQIQSPRVLADGSMLAVLADIVTTSTRGRVEACCTSRYSHHEYSRTSRVLLYQQIQSPRVLADGSRLAVLADIVTTSTRGRVEACCTSRYSHHEYSRTSRGLLYQQIQSPRVLADESRLAVLADIVTTSTRGRVEACCTSRYSHHEYSRTSRGLLYQQIQSPRVLADGSRLAVLADIVITSTRGRVEACCTSRYSHHEYSSTGGRVEACCTSRYSHHEYSRTGRGLLYQQIQSSRVLVDESRLAVLADIVTTSTRGRVEACCTSRYSHHEYSSTGGQVEACCTSRYSHHEYSRTGRCLLYQQIQSPRVLVDESRLAVLVDIVTTSTRGRVEACCTSRYSHHEYSRTSRGLLYQQIQSPRVLADGSMLAVLADIVTTSTRGRVEACCTSRYSHHEYSSTRGRVEACCTSRYSHHEYSRTSRCLLYQQIQSPRVLADESMLAVLADIVTTSTRGRVEACCTSRYSHHEYSSTGGQVEACCTSRYSHHEYSRTGRCLLYQQIQSPRVLEYWRTGRGLLYQQIQSSRVLADGSMLAVLADIVTTSTRGRVEACCTSRYSHHEYSWTSRGLLYQQIQSPRVLADESRLAVLADIVTTSTRGRVDACCTSRYSHHEYSRTSRGLLYQQIQSPRVLADESRLAVLADIVTTSTRGRVDACCTSRYSHHEYSRTIRGLLYQQIQSPRVLADESRLAVLADIVTTSTRGRVEACCTSRYSHHEYSRTSRGLLYQQIQSPRVLADESRLAVLADIVTTSTRGRVEACCTSRYSHHEYSRTSRGLLYQQIQSSRVLADRSRLLYQQIQSSRVLEYCRTGQGCCTSRYSHHEYSSTGGQVEASRTSRYSHHEYSRTSRCLLYQQILSPRVLVHESRLAVLADIVTTSTRVLADRSRLLYQQIQSSRVLADGSRLAVLADIVTTNTRGRVEACCTSRYSHHEYSRTGRGLLYQQIQSSRVLVDGSILAVLADIVITSTRGRVEACCTSRYSHHEYSWTSRGLLYQQIQSPRVLEYWRTCRGCCTSRYSHHEYSWTCRGLLYQQIQSPRVLADRSRLAVLVDIVTTSTCGWVQACCSSRYSHHEYSWTGRCLLYQQIQSSRVLSDGSRLAVLVDIVTTSTCGRVDACCTSRYSHHEYSRTGRGLLYQQIQSPRVLVDGSMLAVLADIVITSTRGRVEACCTSRYSHHEYLWTGRCLLYQQIQSSRVLADGSRLAVLADIVITSTRGRVEA